MDGLVYGYEEKPSDVKEMPHSWDRFVFNPGKWKTGWNAFFAYANGENRQSLKGHRMYLNNPDTFLHMFLQRIHWGKLRS